MDSSISYYLSYKELFQDKVSHIFILPLSDINFLYSCKASRSNTLDSRTSRQILRTKVQLTQLKELSLIPAVTLPPAPKPRISGMSRDGVVEMKFSEPMRPPAFIKDKRRSLKEQLELADIDVTRDIVDFEFSQKSETKV